MKLVELVYEGGEILDLCLGAQRSLLQAELRDRFLSVDLRAKSTKERAKLLRAAANGTVNNVLIRGLSGLQEAANFFTRSALLIDVLGKSDPLERNELAPYAFRTRRAYVYGCEMSRRVRSAGIGNISKQGGPYFPRLDFDLPESLVIGVTSISEGALAAIGKLKTLRTQKNLQFAIVSTERAVGVETVSCALEVSESCSLLVAPNERQDFLGPNEGAILALCTGRALCTTKTDAIDDLPYPPDRYMRAERGAPGSYAACALLYPQHRAVLDAWPASAALDWEQVPRDILRRLDV